MALDGHFLAGSAEEVGTLLDELVQVNGFDLVAAPAGKSEELPGQIRCAPDDIFNGLEVVHVGMQGIDIHQHEGGSPLDAHEEIVEVMRDTAGQGSNGLQLVRLSQVGLETFSGADVADDDNGFILFIADRCDLDGDILAVEQIEFLGQDCLVSPVFGAVSVSWEHPGH